MKEEIEKMRKYIESMKNIHCVKVNEDLDNLIIHLNELENSISEINEKL